MKRVLCYGDSNTFGFIPGTRGRYEEGIRWTSILSIKLGEEYRVIEEGCNGRTTNYNYEENCYRNGLNFIRTAINSHRPIDLVVLMLGSNDLKYIFNASPKDIADNNGKIIDVIRSFSIEKQGYEPKILLVSPPYIGEGIMNSEMKRDFDETSLKKSYELSSEYQRIAKEKGVFFFDSAKFAPPSAIDSLHLDPESHLSLGEEMYKQVVAIL